MSGTVYTILKRYQLFEPEAGQPTQARSETQLVEWLQNRGFSVGEASKIIEQVDERGAASIKIVPTIM